MTNRKITIRFSADKNGKRRAHYWGLAHRWLPISIASAELKLSTGEAVPQETKTAGEDWIDDFNYVGSRHHY